MKWFGNSWGAPVCDPANRVPIPLGMKCIRCGKGFGLKDQGFELPYMGESRIKVVYYHKGCLLREIGVVREAEVSTVPVKEPLETPSPSPAEDAKALRETLDKVVEERAAASRGAKDAKAANDKG